MEFEVKGKICGKGRPRFVRRGQFVQTYTPDTTANYENLIKLSFINARGEIINKPKGVLISIIAGFTPPTSLSKKKQIECLDNKIKCIKKPDIDNITKAVMDALNKIAYEDDSQVVEINVTKRYHEQETLFIEIEEAV